MYFRYRSGGGKSQNQNELTAEELRSFVQQLDNLPCNIRQGPLLKVGKSDWMSNIHLLYHLSE